MPTNPEDTNTQRIEAAREFLDRASGYYGKEGERMKLVNFATEAVRAERERIAEELGAICLSRGHARDVNRSIVSYIDRLRGERE